MASDFHDLRPEQVPNAVTQSFPNVHFLANSSTVGSRISASEYLRPPTRTALRPIFTSVAEMKREAGGQLMSRHNQQRSLLKKAARSWEAPMR
jgi:hypothetical protein